MTRASPNPVHEFGPSSPQRACLAPTSVQHGLSARHGAPVAITVSITVRELYGSVRQGQGVYDAISQAGANRDQLPARQAGAGLVLGIGVGGNLVSLHSPSPPVCLRRTVRRKGRRSVDSDKRIS